MIDFREIEYGFKFGSAEVTRLCSDAKKGWVILRIKTPRAEVQVYVTRTGKVRLYNNGWTEVDNE